LRTEGGTVVLTIADDGQGFDGKDLPGHLGLRSMRERMAQVGGSLTMTSESGLGTRVVVSLPASAC
jgi:signal transduction histidine kinase